MAKAGACGENLWPSPRPWQQTFGPRARLRPGVKIAGVKICGLARGLGSKPLAQELGHSLG